MQALTYNDSGTNRDYEGYFYYTNTIPDYCHYRSSMHSTKYYTTTYLVLLQLLLLLYDRKFI